MTQDVTDDDLASGLDRFRDDFLSLLYRFGEGFLDENISTGIHRGLGILGVGIRIAGDGDGIWLSGREGLLEVAKLGVRCPQLSIQGLTTLGRACNNATNFEAFDGMIGARMGSSHMTRSNA